jgi:cobyrinic acid a,c-diamide synthase
MPQQLCGELFVHGTQAADLAVVMGQYSGDATDDECGGRFETLCQWLELPQLAVIDATKLNVCVPPILPSGVDGLLLNHVRSVEEMCRLQAELESRFRIPVLGSLIVDPETASRLPVPASVEKPSPELCRSLGDRLARWLDLERILEIAERRSHLTAAGCLFCERCGRLNRLNIAVAYDEAFSCYFADTLDMLESLGANVNVFSPLRSERLPNQTDVVYVGCGRPDRYARQLAENVCMREAIWGHVLAGGRVYGECGGMAYLCREIVVDDNKRLPMLGLLPASARYEDLAPPVLPVDLQMSDASWLFSAAESIRGYLNSRWVIQPTEQLVPLVTQLEHRYDVVGDYRVIGSRVHLNFATCPAFLSRFFQPLSESRCNPVT